MTLEQLIATFGEETGRQMFAQVNAQTNTGGAPFPFLKKVSAHGSELGNFGDFVYGTKTEKDASGNRKIIEKGTNVGKEFEFILVNVSYRYTAWDEAKQKGKRSNIFTTLDGINTAVDIATGKPLPATKDEKDAAGWKLNRVNAGLIRKNAKSKWEPVIWETAGALYYSLGQVVGKQPSSGLLSGIIKVKTKLGSKGSIQYPTIDEENSSFEGPLDAKIFETEKENFMAISNKMTEYVSANSKANNTPTAPATAPVPGPSEDDVNW